MLLESCASLYLLLKMKHNVQYDYNNNNTLYFTATLKVTSESALHRKGYKGKSKKQYDNNRKKNTSEHINLLYFTSLVVTFPSRLKLSKELSLYIYFQ